ncbi:MAG: acetyl-CoA carboxylase biotin carboxyl carrier protein [Campylobacteraceae bacterium]|nr:acetyl-CoA carboxylase biotin carboxyl carrier protein [Campylobacteraceae bacterium]
MDFKEIKELIRVFDKSELNKLKVKEGEFEVAMQKGFEGGTVVTTSAPATVAAPATAPVAAPAAATEATPAVPAGDTINSPMVGTFYAAPSPEASDFVKKGDTVKKGQTLCILEAMKIMNEVEAEYDCKIVDILIENGNPVEYDMPMFVVEKL